MEGLGVLREVAVRKLSVFVPIPAGGKGDSLPEHVAVLEVGLRITLLGVDEHGELARIANEEDGGVVLWTSTSAFRTNEVEPGNELT